MQSDPLPDTEHISAHLVEDGHVLRILLNRPRANILTLEMMGEISTVLKTHRNDPHLRIVLIRGAGGNFSFGASVDEHRRDVAAKLLKVFHTFIREIAAYPVPVAALAEGRCFGGAFELALCCHLVFATVGTRFACPEIKLGVFPPVLAAIGPLRLGGALAERMMLSGTDISGAAGERLGFVAAVFEDEDIETRAMEWIRAHILSLSAHSLRVATRVSRMGSGILAALDTRLEEAERAYVDDIVGSHDGNEGIEAFIEHRTPVWLDR